MDNIMDTPSHSHICHARTTLEIFFLSDFGSTLNFTITLRVLQTQTGRNRLPTLVWILLCDNRIHTSLEFPPGLKS